MNEPSKESPPEDQQPEEGGAPQHVPVPSDQTRETLPHEVISALTRAQENPFKPAYQQMLNEIRVWGWAASLLGVLHFIISGILNPAWGISLFAVGGISFLFREASMFVVYAVMIAWVGLSNVLSGGFGGWTIFGAVQAYWSYQIYRKYQLYAVVEQKYEAVEAECEAPGNRAQELFPGIGCALGVVGLVGSIGVFIVFVSAAAVRGVDASMPENFQIVEFILGGLLASGILGFGLSVAALAARYPRKWLAWIGAMAGGLLMVLEIYLRVMVI